MIKLKKVINHLDDNTYKDIVDQFSKTKAENFLFLLQSYRKNAITDNDIMKKLELTNNSFYVLKSRLYEKIQTNLSAEIDITKEDVLNQFHQLPEISFSTSREVATAILLKLEKDLLTFDLHNELVILYSILKRLNLYSDKYFHYSQLYNKQIAYTLSIEKSLDLLGEFNRKLNEYMFSKVPGLINELLFLHKEIEDYFLLNSDRQIEVIKYFIELQLIIFCDQLNNNNTEEILNKANALLSNLPESSQLKKWLLPLNYLYFEYYVSKRQSSQAEIYYLKTEKDYKTLLLANPICISSRYLLSKTNYLIEKGRIGELKKMDVDSILFDPHDPFSIIRLNLYKSLLMFFNNNAKGAVAEIADILNNNSLRDFVHINVEVKLTLAYYYLHLEEFDLADHILKNLSRKLKLSDSLDYKNVNDLIKFFNYIISNADLNVKNQKQKDTFALFIARNKGEIEVVSFLVQDMLNKFS